ncbi:GTPase Era [Buchnera aphidicola (Taiwanaphis decaspermi)]|uniref:GTPase Era n=1 Tax=Buchnera aphidicola TaxID=9 RepID=UPI0031B7F809
MIKKKSYCGEIPIIGKSNVGKSTLINKLIGKKISITSKKNNTTQKNILGIKTFDNYQSIYIDCPGVIFNKKKNNYYFDKKTMNYILNSKLVIFVIDNIYWGIDEEKILFLIKKYNNCILLVINKIDLLKNKKKLLPYLNFLNKKTNFLSLIPVSAKKNINIKNIIKVVNRSLPIKKHFFSSKKTNNLSKHFMIKEIVREKLMRNLNMELPYDFFLKINSFYLNEKNEYNIKINIFVNSLNKKKIFIGKKASKIKLCSLLSRINIEKFLQNKVNLMLWVKTKY